MPTKPLFVVGAAAALLGLAGCAEKPSVSFQQDVKPILAEHCGKCHTGDGPGVQASGFEVGTYEQVMAGTRYGPVVVEGDALSSSLYRLVSGEVDESIRMPHGEASLPQPQIETIETWIDQGALNN
ncbi:MAG: hypothetical protein PVG98_07405 [Chromatiales bacterium]